MIIIISTDEVNRIANGSQKQITRCCYGDLDGGCKEPATHEIRWGDEPEQYTHSCRNHIGDLIETGVVNTVYPIEQAVK